MGAQQQARQISNTVANREDSDGHNGAEVTDHLLTYLASILGNIGTWI